MTDWVSLPPLPALRAFAAYAETGSLTAAGARLNVTHSAISQQIRALEAHLSLTLLERNGRHTALSPQGTRLARALGQGFDIIARGIDELTGADARRPVHLSLTPSFASTWLMPRLGDLHAAFPDLNLMIDPSPDLRELTPGGLDLAIRYGTGRWQGLEAELLLASPAAIVAAPGLVGAERFDGPGDLARFHWLQELGVNETSAWFSRFGVTREIEGGVTTLPGNLMLEAARAGQGIAISARVFVEDDIAAGRLRLLFEDDFDKGYYIVTRPGVQRAPVKNLLRWLRRQKAGG